VSFVAITLYASSQRVFIVISLRLSPETFGYTLVEHRWVDNNEMGLRKTRFNGVGL
jgi:hypothetical protein